LYYGGPGAATWLCVPNDKGIWGLRLLAARVDSGGGPNLLAGQPPPAASARAKPPAPVGSRFGWGAPHLTGGVASPPLLLLLSSGQVGVMVSSPGMVQPYRHISHGGRLLRFSGGEPLWCTVVVGLESFSISIQQDRFLSWPVAGPVPSDAPTCNC
jgi:hypothetical protein